MARIFYIVIFLAFHSIMAHSQNKIMLSNGDKSITATLSDSEAARQLQSKLMQSPIRVDLSEYGGFEMVGRLPWSLPTSNRQISTVAGDIMLYQGNNIVIFYGTNSWSYTPLGKIDNATTESVKEFLGSGSATLTISLVGSAGVTETGIDSAGDDIIYDLAGRKVNTKTPTPGVYIKNGKKILVR